MKLNSLQILRLLRKQAPTGPNNKANGSLSTWVNTTKSYSSSLFSMFSSSSWLVKSLHSESVSNCWQWMSLKHMDLWMSMRKTSHLIDCLMVDGQTQAMDGSLKQWAIKFGWRLIYLSVSTPTMLRTYSKSQLQAWLAVSSCLWLSQLGSESIS